MNEPSLTVSPELRASEPHFAAVIDLCRALFRIIDARVVLADIANERIAKLEAENASLRARLSSKDAA